ncbi:hypothetical protein EYF80_049720 [Liparis tanakae]|uniref:Uncharacterized protein n=1 Tax=Liparis tanakae TaxID=230148 RepID=A0A4Z2FFW4_9TELE|nr:hypothetical protein EYF80_049720 [Liparis tanakae]
MRRLQVCSRVWFQHGPPGGNRPSAGDSLMSHSTGLVLRLRGKRCLQGPSHRSVFVRSLSRAGLKQFDWDESRASPGEERRDRQGLQHYGLGHQQREP